MEDALIVARQPSEFRLPKQPLDQVPGVLAASGLGQDRSGHAGQSERAIQVAIVEAGIRGDLAAMEFQLPARVEIDCSRREWTRS